MGSAGWHGRQKVALRSRTNTLDWMSRGDLRPQTEGQAPASGRDGECQVVVSTSHKWLVVAASVTWLQEGKEDGGSG